MATALIIAPGQAVAVPGRAVRALASASENLGVPLHEINVRGATVGTLADGRPVACTYSNGATGVFSVLDGVTGERLAAHTIAEGNSFDLLVAADHTVYISTHGSGLFRYFPARDQVVHLGRPAGEPNVLGTVSDQDGVVYGGTYPNAHAFRYDPVADEFFDYGPVATTESYLRNVAYDGDRTLYASTRPNGLLFAIDVTTGDKRELALPESAVGSTNLQLVYVAAPGLLLVRASPEWAWHVYDPKPGAWVDHIDNASQSSTTDAIRRKTYFVDGSENLVEYDLTSRTVSPTGWVGGQLHYTATQGLGVGTLPGADSRDYPGKSVIGVGRTGRIWHFNPKTGAYRFISGDPLGSEVGLHKVGLGLDGYVYVGGYLTTGIMARYDPVAGDFEQIQGPQQVEGFVNHQGKLYLSAYPEHKVMEYDPAGDWDYGTNPRTAFSLGEGQDRARPLEPLPDGRLAIGTQADSRQGVLDGQLILYDPATGTADPKGAPIPGHGVASLASNGSILFGGTTCNHLAAPPQDPPAKLFAWNPESDQLLWSLPVVSDANVICGLVFDDGGRLWGLASTGVVFEFDIATQTVVRSVKAVDSANGAASFFSGPDGRLYGSTAGTYSDSIVFAVDVGSLEAVEIGPGAFPALGDNGRIYYTRGAELHRFTR